MTERQHPTMALISKAKARLLAFNGAFGFLSTEAAERMANTFIMDLIHEQGIPLYGPGWDRSSQDDIRALDELLCFDDASGSTVDFYTNMICEISGKARSSLPMPALAEA